MKEAIRLHDITPIEKPAYGEPCNGCGWCCHEVICEIGEFAYPGESAPCPGMQLNRETGRIDCSLMVMEAESGSSLIRDSLGSGKGCCSDDPQGFSRN